MTTSRDKYNLAFSFWTAAVQYLNLAENVAQETVSQGNVWVMSRDFQSGPITTEEYKEGTRWSDHRIIIPLLFNLLHGIEILVKGFILVDPNDSIQKDHKICALCERFKQKYPDESELIGFFNKYTTEERMPQLLRQFLEDNTLEVERLYQALRYPSPDFQICCKYSSLSFQGEEGTPFFSDLSVDINSARRAAVRLGRSLEPEN
jgi:hypothetical protein